MTHKLAHLLDCLAINSTFEMSLFEKFKIFLLVLVRIVFYEPKLTFSLNSRKIELRELFLL